MDYPIPKSSADAFITHQQISPQNAGLIFERFAPNWEGYPQIKGDGLKAALSASTRADKNLLSAWNTRWEKIVTAARAHSFELQTDWRLIAGLGRKGSLEVGFTFHRYGFPFLPGSSIKGLARARGLLEIAAKLGEQALKKLHEKILHTDPKIGLLGALDVALSHEEEKDFETDMIDCGAEVNSIEMAKAFRAIFGTTESAGRVVFFDAIPSSSELPTLEMDIMNPHYPDYYKEGSKEYPTDWQSPIPVYFLTVATGVKFRFAIGWRKSSEDTSPNSELKKTVWNWFKEPQSNEQSAQEHTRLQKLARQWLQGGLLELGAGGKTNAGYGFFINPGAKNSELKPNAQTSRSLPPGYERGIVKDFELGDNKSYGHIYKSNRAELFVHKNSLSAGINTLKPGQKVIFKIGKGPKGPQAQDVQLDE
jgi:CRISPR-associated protein Cmr6